jgi:hypothetical protein
MVEIAGFAAPRFAAVQDAFAANFAQGLERGARFTVVQAGEVVVDLWAGVADGPAWRTAPASGRSTRAP